mgnify:CR=1 FL=1
MFVLNITQPITVLLLLMGTILLIFLGHELKKSYIAAIPLFAFLVLLIIHVTELVTLPVEYSNLSQMLVWSMVLDFAFIFITFMSYLWVDELEAKKNNKKSIDNSLDWFWKQV